MSNTQMLPKSATNQQPQAVANNITITHKEYAVLLNERANYPLRADMITHGGVQEVYWNCPHENNHPPYRQRVGDRLRTSAQYCKECARLGISQRRLEVVPNNLLVTHKEYALLWNAKLNYPLQPAMVTFGSDVEVYWNCPHGNNHAPYLQKVIHRLKASITYCKECIRLGIAQPKQRQVLEHNITQTHAEHVTWWVREENKDLDPRMFTWCSEDSKNTEVYWRCPQGRNHVYKQSIAQRLLANPIYCKECARLGIKQQRNIKRKIDDKFILANARKDLIHYWDASRNLPLTVYTVSIYSPTTASWICPKCNNSYEAQIDNRVNRKSPLCNECLGRVAKAGETDLYSQYTDLVKNFWDYNKNTLDPKKEKYTSSKEAWFICPTCKQSYQTEIRLRVVRTTALCNDCAGFKTQSIRGKVSLADKYPEYVKFWNNTLNEDVDPKEVPYGSQKEYYWDCPHGRNHTYLQSVHLRVHAPLMFCRKCADLMLPQDYEVIEEKDGVRKTVVKHAYGSIGNTFPELLPLWDKEANGDADPYKIAVGINDKYMWHCPNDKIMKHSYPCAVARMTKDVALTLEKGHCCYCRGMQVLEGYNDLASWAKRNGLDYLIEEWDNEKNGNIKITDRPFGSGKTAAWVCRNCGYSWDTKICNRTKNRSGCPLCKASKLEQFGYGVLTQWNVRFIKEKRFTEFYNISSFQFDYYLPDYKIIIEFDGLQHFKEDVTWKEIIPFNERVRRDKIKNTVLFKNGVPILRIPYIYDPTKKKYQDQIEAYIKTFIQTKKIPQEIIDFYEQYEFSNYAELARKWNVIRG
jgi:very-short-patch-repair endonuclease